MRFLSGNPFVKITSFAVTGILVANFAPWSVWIFLVLGLTLIYLASQSARKNSYRQNFVQSAILGITILLLSMINVVLHQQKVPETPAQAVTFLGTLLEKPTKKTNSYQALLQIESADVEPLSQQKIIVYFSKDTQTDNLQAGTQILTRARITAIKNSGNPFGFDYQTYMARQGIHFCTFIGTNKIDYIPAKHFSLKIAAEQFREKLLSLLKTKLHNHEAFQVVSALTLGYRKELSAETRSYFSATGAMHVLAVSGLHVGMIFMFLSWLLSFLKHTQTGRVVTVCLIGCCLWGYALLTGFSPSVQRATVMFTFILIGNSLNRPTPIYNSIAASAFFLLLMNPGLLFDVGFQLSYMAVVSIVFFYPRLEKIFPVTNPVTKRIWQLFCVSVAAQIGTAPLSLYYFHQFPVFFWLSNFVVIPAAYLILGSTFSLFIFCMAGPISDWIAWFLNGVTQVTLWLLQFISQLPCALITDIPVSGFQLMCLISLVISLLLFIHFRRHRYFFLGLGLIILFQIAGLIDRIHLFDQQKLIVYQTKTPVVHLINGRENYLLTTNEQSPNSFLYENVVRELRLNPPRIIHLSQDQNQTMPDLILDKHLIQFGKYSLFLSCPKETTGHQAGNGQTINLNSLRTTEIQLPTHCNLFQKQHEHKNEE